MRVGVDSFDKFDPFRIAEHQRLTGNQSQTEHLFEQIFINNVGNIDKEITDEEAQQKISTDLVNFTVEVSKQFGSPKEKELAQGIIPYIMLEYVGDINSESISTDLINEEERSDSQSNSNKPQKGFGQLFRENLERLKPSILENIAKHWKSIAGATTLGATAHTVTKFALGYTAPKAILMSGSLALALFIGWEVYEHFTKNK